MWAPTAQSVELLHYDRAEGGEGTAVAMQRGACGQWSCPRPADWDKHYYRFQCAALLMHFGMSHHCVEVTGLRELVRARVHRRLMRASVLRVQQRQRCVTAGAGCRLKVYHYSTQRVELLTATDPYSRGLTADGGRSMFVDLQQDATLMPPGWLEHASPAAAGASLHSLSPPCAAPPPCVVALRP